MTPGDYKIKVVATYGTSQKTFDIPIKVVQYLILEVSNSFSPGSITVKQGTTVYWINLDTPGGGETGIHNVVFSSGSTAQSPNMEHLNTFSFAFTAPGTYSYFCAYHPGMKGTVTVTA
jgi:plastocyanin